MNRREFCKGAVLGAAGLAMGDQLLSIVEAQTQPSTSGTPAEKPNIIYILADDVGMPNIGCYGGNFKTPEIDLLAKGGVQFEYCYAMPLCGPSRCMGLTGRYPFRTGLVSNNSEGALRDRREIMIPKIMKAAGYVTASVGKWGQMPFDPGTWGFDEYLTWAGSGLYWREKDRRTTYVVNGKTLDFAEGKYMPDLMHDFLMEFINKNKDRPFFVYYPMSDIHEPILRTPESGPKEHRFLGDNISYMDKLVGKLVAELERLNLRQKTLILFTGDNGSASGQFLVNGKPINGKKGEMWEGGSRVPLIVNWPGVTPAGKICKDLTDFSDFYPTFAEIGGGKLPAGVPIDGRSFAPQVRGEAGNPRQWIYVELSGECYVRDGQWKHSGGAELFDMKEAPYKEPPADVTVADAAAAQKRLQKILDTTLNGHPKGKKLTPVGKRPSAQG
jgi:arylsulfatase A